MLEDNDSMAGTTSSLELVDEDYSIARPPKAYKDYDEYLTDIRKNVDLCYDIAQTARKKGFDPKLEVEIPAVDDLALRVEKLVNFPGVAEKIRFYTSRIPNRITASFEIGKEIALELKKKGGLTDDEILYQAVRTGLAIMTEGVLVAPLEGVTAARVNKNPDGSTYLSLQFSGPIRSAGGTAQALCVLLGDYIRRAMGVGAFKPTRNIIDRYKEEVMLYRRAHSLQYTPSQEEIETVVKNCPVCIDGEGTEEVEVSGNRDIEGLDNKVRGGAVLVICEGICLKAKKILKSVDELKLDGWSFLNILTKKKDSEGMKENDKGDDPEEVIQELNMFGEKLSKTIQDELVKFELDGNKKFMKDVLAGRPIFGFPQEKGGFRLRYGRTRLTGVASIAIHPAITPLLDDFLAIGTQIKIERPGKAGVVTLCDSIEPPIVLLKNGILMEVETIEQAASINDQVERIVDMGEILIPYGEFLENNHELIKGAYSIEWWIQEYAKAREMAVDDVPPWFWSKDTLNASDAIELSKRHKTLPLHPDYNLFWSDLSIDDIRYLHKEVLKGHYENNELTLPFSKELKEILIKLGALHTQEETKEGTILRISRYAEPILAVLSIDRDLKPIKNIDDVNISVSEPLIFLYILSGLKLRERGSVRIGARMGRPEKANLRAMKNVHGLFPIGHSSNDKRLLKDSLKAKTRIKQHGEKYGGVLQSEKISKTIEIEVGKRRCPNCGKIMGVITCPKCNVRTDPISGEKGAPGNLKIDLHEVVSNAAKKLNMMMEKLPNIKLIKGMTSARKTPEPIEKAMLRGKHGIYVFRDGTIRYDMTDVPITHFRPSEIGTPITKLHELGYKTDWEGRPLINRDQIVELKAQDIILPKVGGDYMLKVSQFVDDELKYIYGMPPFYNAKTRKDLIGHLFIGLAPHTSAGVVGRLIGFAEPRVGLAHPYFHTAKRRNCDGDEDSVMLLLDGLLNFSREYLPDRRGGLMDAPLVVTTKINPDEVDKEVRNVDLMTMYPLEFYQKAQSKVSPKNILNIMDIVDKRIGEPTQYCNFKFTHHVANINEGPNTSSYKTLPNMQMKMDGQLKIARRVDAVDINKVAEKIIANHFLPDIIGNLSSFSKQKFRCSKCNTTFRRYPLSGRCPNCNKKLNLTVNPKSVVKYLDKSINLMETYSVDSYVYQRINILKDSIDNTLIKDPNIVTLNL